MADLNLGVLISAKAVGLTEIDKLVAELRDLGLNADQAEAEAKQLAAALQKAATQQALIEQFRTLKKETVAAQTAFKAASDRAKELGVEFGKTEAPTKKMQAEFGRARKAANDAEQAYNSKRIALQGLRAQLAAAGVSSDSFASAAIKAKKAVADATKEVSALQKSLTSKAQAASNAGVAASKAAGSVKQLGAEAKATGQHFESMGPALAKISALLGAGFSVKGIAEAADAMQNLAARLRVATGSSEGVTKALAEIRETANQSGASLDAVGELYARLARTTKDLGATQAEVAEVTKIVTQALAASGEAGVSAEAAIVQLGQAFASGQLRGDELRSVMEQIPRLSRAIADGLGVSIGKLRELSEAGKLTSVEVFRAIQSQKAVIESEFAFLPNTIGRAVNRVNNEWRVFIAELDKTTGASNAAANALNAVSQNLDVVVGLATDAGLILAASLIGKAIPAVKAFGAEMMAAKTTAGSLAVAMGKIPTSIKIGIAIIGADLAITLVQNMARSVAALVESSKEADAAAEASLQRWRDMAVETHKTVVAFEEYANVRVKTSDEVAKLTDQEREAYREALSGAQQYQLALYQNAIAWEALGKNTETTQEKTRVAVAALKSGLKEFEVGAALAANAAKSLLSLDALKLVNQFDELRKKGKTVAEALREVSAAFDAGSLAKVQAYGQALGELADRGILTARDLREEWEAALAPLSAERLVEFQITAQAAFGDTRQEVASLTAATDVLSRRALAELGVDADRALSGMSSKAREAVASVDLLIGSTTQLKAQGVEVGKVLSEALTAAIGAADTQQAVEALRERIAELGKAGTVATQDIEALTAALTEQAALITPGIQSAKEAYEALGITSSAALQQAAAGAREAYEALIRLGVPLDDQKAAFLAYAEAAIKANGGVADAGVKARASALGLSDAIAKLVGGQQQAQQSAQGLKDAWDQQARVGERATEAVRQHGIAMVAAAQQALEAAKAQGDALAIEEATVQVRQAEAKAAADLAVALQAEADAARANVAAMLEKAQADGVVTDAEQQLLDTVQRTADELQKQADAAKSAAQSAQQAAQAATAKKEEVRTASVDWTALAGSYGLAADKGGQLSQIQAQMWAGMQKIYSTGFGSLDGYIDAMNAATEQAARYVHALDAVENAARGGDETLGRYIRALRNAIHQGGLLGSEELRPLRDALRDAQDRMRALSESAHDTLNSLRDELDEMNKNYDEIEKRRAEARKAEIMAQIAIAKSAGNSAAVADLTRALALLNQISSTRIKEAAARERDEARSLKGGVGTAAQPAPATDMVVTKVVDLNIKVGDDTGTAKVVEGGEEVIVDMLRKAQMVAS